MHDPGQTIPDRPVPCVICGDNVRPRDAEPVDHRFLSEASKLRHRWCMPASLGPHTVVTPLN